MTQGDEDAGQSEVQQPREEHYQPRNLC